MHLIKTGLNRDISLDSIGARLRTGRPRKRILFRAGVSEFFPPKCPNLHSRTPNVGAGRLFSGIEMEASR